MNDRRRRSELVHDIRNRLAIARANIEAFIDGKLHPTKARFRAILQSLRQLDALLDEVKVADAADAEVRPVEIDVCDLLQREYGAIEPMAVEKRIAFSVGRCASKAPACARFLGDPVRIGQIVSNVLLNAVRYTPEGGSIDVECTPHGDGIEVAIADSGPGVTKRERERIFEGGYRGSAGKGKPGSGFGLSIAKQFVEAHGGTIELEQRSLRTGARFVVRLPGTVAAGLPNAATCERCGPNVQAPPSRRATT